MSAKPNGTIAVGLFALVTFARWVRRLVLEYPSGNHRPSSITQMPQPSFDALFSSTVAIVSCH